ncbi:MAG: ketopantoate reductase family protein [Anaerolineae bacterium]
MRILVYGAGAVGGYVGARLAQDGHDVTLVVREVTAEAINADGLSVTEESQTAHVRPTAVSSIAQAFMAGDVNYDLIIMGMKSYDLVEALDPLVAFCPDPPPIITLQNGIGVEKPLIKQYGASKIIAGSLTTPISKETTTRLVVERTKRGLGLAPTQPGQDIQQWVSLFKQTGIHTVQVKDYQSMKWSKALLNIVGNATSAILNRSPGVIYKSAALFDLELRMIRETLAVMEAQGLAIIDLPGSPASKLAAAVNRMPKALLRPILRKIVASGRGDKMPSFHIDLMAGRGKSEVIYHNGAIARTGKALNIPTPVNHVLTDVLWKLAREEVDWQVYDGRPRELLAELKRFEQAARRRVTNA